MNSTKGETLGRIQQEIKESMEREEELRRKYEKLNLEEVPERKLANGDSHINNSPPPLKDNINPLLTMAVNGFSKKSNNNNSKNNGRIFVQNSPNKGVMQKFLRMRGRVSTATHLAPSNNNMSKSSWTHNDAAFTPAKVTVEPGKTIRNGFVPAEEKMRRELQEFQKREDELRMERRKSQPNLMAALEAEQEMETNLRPARSLAFRYSTEELVSEDSYSSGAGSLRPAKSLAELCDASDDDLEAPGTHSLILQFEKMKRIK